jgi:arylformamidase
MKKPQFYDITHSLDQSIAVWPGDSSFRYSLGWDMQKGDSCNVGAVTMSCHTGTHADAPFHFTREGQRVGEMDLSIYWGPCWVVDIPTGSSSVTLEHLKGIDFGIAPRVLFKTGSFPRREQFPESVVPISPELAAYLKQHGVFLIGTDAPSVDPLDSKTLSAHHALLENEIAILESLALQQVPAGRYELVALPLKLSDGDGSPVRAVLKTLELK